MIFHKINYIFFNICNKVDMAEISDDIRAANARRIEQLCRNIARDVLANDFQKMLQISIELPMPSAKLSHWVSVDPVLVRVCAKSIRYANALRVV